jgi:acetyltransferase-like isoleucine patch superfamily enzyme
MEFVVQIIRKFFSSMISVFHVKKDIKFAKTGYKCVFTSNSKIYNHSRYIDAITIGDGVTIDGILEVYENGSLFIDSYTFFGNSRIFCANSIRIGKGCWIADHVFLMDSDLHPISSKRRLQDAIDFSKGIFPDVYKDIPNSPTIIGDSVWIGVNSVILKGVKVGEGAVIGAGSVVTKDVPAWTIVAGNPAQVIREIPEHER